MILISLLLYISLNYYLKRQGAKAGLWCGFLLPIAMILSCCRYQTSSSYEMTSLCCLASSVYIVLHLFNWKPLNVHVIASTITLLSCYLLTSPLNGIMRALRLSCVIILFNMKSYSLLEQVLHKFPHSFSIGEAVLIVEGIIIFLFSTFANLFAIEPSSNSTLFSQVSKNQGFLIRFNLQYFFLQL